MAEEDISCAHSASPGRFLPPVDNYTRDGASAGLVGCFTPDLVFRNFMSFDMSVITPPVTVSLVELRVTISATSGDPSAKTYKINAYGSNGLGTPQTDSDQTAYEGCAGTNYISGNTSFRSTGAKTVDLTAASASHIEAAIAAGALFSIGIQETGENPSTEHIVKPDGDGGTVAILHVEYSIAVAANSAFAFWRWR